jgi:hypothetical protein
MSLTRKEQLITELSPGQLTFVNELVVNGGDRRKAYIVAYPTSNEAYASANASHLLDVEKVQEYYMLLQTATLIKYKVTRQDLISMHMRIIKAYDKLLSLIEKDNKTEQDYLDISTYKGYIKASDYKDALEQIGRLQGDYVERHEINDKRQIITINTGSIPMQIEAEDVTNIKQDLLDNTSPDKDTNNNPDNLI